MMLQAHTQSVSDVVHGLSILIVASCGNSYNCLFVSIHRTYYIELLIS